jgi:sigma-B regulation protein RsbU (phosphoserine phosphatase)
MSATASAQTLPLVLVVDDSPSSRDEVGELLKGDYRCLFAHNGVEALKKVFSELPDAVVTDIEMPMMDGIQLLRAIRADQRTARLPVVVMTQSTSLDAFNRARAFGSSGVVSKPVDRDYLLAKLGALLRDRAAQP